MREENLIPFLEHPFQLGELQNTDTMRRYQNHTKIKFHEVRTRLKIPSLFQFLLED